MWRRRFIASLSEKKKSKTIAKAVVNLIGNVYTDGNYAYYERFDSDTLVVSKKNSQQIERKYLSLRTWCSRLVRRGGRFSKTEHMHKICVGIVINFWFLGWNCIIQRV
ncbi:MAG: IS1 family transposase [Planctomycetaceae bacterium]|nr:IS1 family transposase [Planctomycetaceae bacterium]